MTEMEVLEQSELVSDIASSIQNYGAKRLADELRTYFPEHFKELLVQMQRKPVPALFKNADPSWCKSVGMEDRVRNK